MKNLGENDTIDSGEIEDVSYVPQEADVETSEEKSDAQLLSEGEITLNEGDVEIFVDPHSVHKPKKAEEKEEESEEEEVEEESSEEEVKEEEQEEEVEQEEKPAKKVAKKPAAAPDPVQKRINKITREKYEALRETERLAKELAELKAAHKETKLAADKSNLEMSKPKQEDFETDEEYYEQLGRWGARMELHEQQATQEETVVEEEEPVNPVQRIIDVGKETYPDFEDLVLREDLKITPLMVEAAADSEYASDIFYYLGQNPEYAATISNMRSPAKVAREIGRIEDKFISEEVEEVVTQEANTEGEFPTTPKPKKKIKSPPPPVKPLGGSGKATTSLEDAGIAEYYELRGYDRTGMKKRTT